MPSASKSRMMELFAEDVRNLHRGLLQVGPTGPSCGEQYHPFKSFAPPFPAFFAAAVPNAPATPDAGLASA